MSKVAIITGSTGNLGKAVTSQMISAGFTVVGTYEPGLNADEGHEKATYQAVDLSDADATEKFILGIAEEYGRIDSVVCLVGGFAMSTLMDSNSSDIDKMITLNFKTALNTVQPVLGVMKEQESIGNIILIGAKPVFEVDAFKSVFPYALSKSMVLRIAEVINADTQANKARATVIVPSIIDTPPNREAMPDANFADWVTPESIAEKIAFICSEDGRDLQQTVLHIYGNS